MTTPTTLYPRADCPVLQQAEAVFSHAKNLRTSINKLRKSLAACQDCPNAADCYPLKEFNRQVDVAIDELTAEWGLV